jgi:hypothetical protein
MKIGVLRGVCRKYSIFGIRNTVIPEKLISNLPYLKPIMKNDKIHLKDRSNR